MCFPADEEDDLPMFKHNRLEDKPNASRPHQFFPDGDTSQEVSCELVPSDLEERPEDIALSYVWVALIAIFRHTWWTHLWVYPEVAAAKNATVVVGLHAFAWDLFLPLLRP